jgi:hypothetical protein
MVGHYLLAGGTLLVVFIFFLVISRTLTVMANLLVKIEYMLQKEYDLKQEALEVRRLMEEEARREKEMEQLEKEH